jgi:peptide/nickel transport system substrate-binding protein
VIDLPDGKKGMEIDLELRDMRWGDGTLYRRRTSAFTLEVGKHPMSRRRLVGEFISGSSSSDAKDDRRFTMTIDRVTFDYNSLGLNLLPAHIEKPIFDANPAEYRNKTRTTPNSTNPGLAFGPLPHRRVVPGSRIVLEQNPTWTGEKPHFKRIVVKIIENTARSKANLLSGNVDYVLGELGPVARPGAGFEKRHKDKYNFIYKPALIYEHIDVMLDNKLLDDRRVRQAILAAIDRKAISEKLFEGKQPIADGPISPLDPMFSPDTRNLRLRSGRCAQASWTKRASPTSGTACATTPRASAVARDHHHRRQPRARAGDAGDPEPAAARSASNCASRPSRRASSRGAERRQFTGLAMYAWVQSPRACRARLLYSTEIPTAENAWSGPELPGLRNPAMDARSTAAERELISTSAARCSPRSSASMPRTCRCCRCSSASIPS